MQEVITAKWGNNIAVRLPKKYTEQLNIKENEKLIISVKDNTLTLAKPRAKKTISEIVFEKTGLTLDEYVEKYPYDGSDYISAPSVGNEVFGD